MPRTCPRGPTRSRGPPPRICRRVSRPSPAIHRSPASEGRTTSHRGPAAPLVTVPRVAVPWVAISWIGWMRPVLAPARTGTFGAGVTSRAAIGRPRFFLTTTPAPRPLCRDRIRLGLRRASATQVREPLVVGIVPGTTSALIPLTLVTVAAGSPWISDSLRNRGPATLGGSLRGRPLIGVAVLVRTPPAVVLPGLRATVVRWPGFVDVGVSRPLVRLCLRPS
jgi:hypothetical protein